jgi:hypothetical protein
MRISALQAAAAVAGQRQVFGQSTICVQRNWAMGFWLPSGVTTASQTWVDRPW